MQVEWQVCWLVSDYNNVWIFIGRFLPLFINFINSIFFSRRWISITLSILLPPAISYFSFVYCIINFIINFDFFFFFFSISYGFSCWPYLTYMVGCKLSCKLLIITCVRFVITCDGYLLVVTCKRSQRRSFRLLTSDGQTVAETRCLFDILITIDST